MSKKLKNIESPKKHDGTGIIYAIHKLKKGR